MSNQPLNSPQLRAVGGTEHSWCKAVLGGTGIAVLAILTTKNPDISRLRNALHKLQNSHPILRSRLHYNPSGNTFSFVTSPSPFIHVKSFNQPTTSNILENLYNKQENQNISPLHLILEHELNQNAWTTSGNSSNTKTDVFFASVYALPGAKWVVVLRLHASACDRTTAVSLLRELLTLTGINEEKEETESQCENKEEVSLAIEDLVPKGKTKKTIWARGVDMLSYSVNSFRLTNLKFKDTKSPRSTQVVRLLINPEDTKKILSGCEARGIKLCGALSAAGLIAAHNSKWRCSSDYQKKKYGVVTLTDCRSILEPQLSDHHFGFYHSAILNTHVIKGGEKLWELAKKMYTSFTNSKNCNRHLSDMADLNFLMCRAMENPGLTSSSSLRTSLISVFEDTVFDESNDQQKQVGLGDYMACASTHGIGPSIAIFDTIRDGRLDCIFVYPSPLHSREQIQELVDGMYAILVDAGKNVADEN